MNSDLKEHIHVHVNGPLKPIYHTNLPSLIIHSVSVSRKFCLTLVNTVEIAALNAFNRK